MTFTLLGAGRSARASATRTTAPATVAPLLVQRVPWISAEQSAGEVLRNLRCEALDPRTIQNLFVLDGSGVVRGAVALRTLLSSHPNATIGDLVSSRMLTVGRDAAPDAVAQLMEQNQVSVLPVVDGAGRPLGAVVLEDLHRHLLRRGPLPPAGHRSGRPERSAHSPTLEGSRAGAAGSLVGAVEAIGRSGRSS